MPHERGPLPVLPSEFSCLLSPIPKLASAARSPVTHTVNGIPACRLSKPLTPRHLATMLTAPPEGLALPRPANACVPIHNSQSAPTKPAPFPEKIGIGRKDATTIVARPGQPCKPPGREAGQPVRACLFEPI